MSNFTQTGPIYKALLPNPGQVLQFAERNRQLQEQRAAELYKEQVKQQAGDLEKAYKYKPDPVMAQYRAAMGELVKGATEKWGHLIKTSAPDYNGQIRRDQSDIDTDAGIINDAQKAIGETIVEADRKLGDLPMYHADIVKSKASRLIYNDDGTQHPLWGNLVPPSRLADKINDLDGILNSADAINVHAINKQFAESISGTENSDIGIKNNIETRYTTKNKFALLDDKGNIVYDPKSGKVQLNVTPELVNQYLKVPKSHIMVDDLLAKEKAKGNKDFSVADAVKELLYSSGYTDQGGYSKKEFDKSIVDKSGFQINFLGGSKNKEQEYLKGAEYFHDLVHGDPATKNKLLGDYLGKNLDAKYKADNNSVEVHWKEPIYYNGEIDGYKELSKDISLDNEDRALSELNNLRNTNMNGDLKNDLLREAYKKVKEKRPTPKVNEADKFGLN
jgi:hypothetical protein